MITNKKLKNKKKPRISLVLYATWYFFPDFCTSEYNFFYSDIQDQAKNPRTLTLIHRYAISLDLRLSSPNPHAKRLSSFRTFLSLCALDYGPVPRSRYTN